MKIKTQIKIAQYLKNYRYNNSIQLYTYNVKYLFDIQSNYKNESDMN